MLRLDNLTQPRGLLSKGTAGPAYSVYVNLQGRLVFTFLDESGEEQTFISAANSALRTGRFYRIAVVRRHQSKTRDVQRTRRVNGENVTVNVPEVEEWDDVEIHVCEWKTDRYERRIALAQKYGGPKPRENSENLIIGRAFSRNSAPFKGVMGEVRIWNRGLGQLETCQNIIGIESGLVSWWRFDENDGYATDDVTGTNPAALNLVDWVRNPTHWLPLSASSTTASPWKRARLRNPPPPDSRKASP